MKNIYFIAGFEKFHCTFVLISDKQAVQTAAKTQIFNKIPSRDMTIYFKFNVMQIHNSSREIIRVSRFFSRRF